jgi:hypothetical protein
MKLVIAGSRTLKPTTEQIETLLTHFKLKPSEIVSGGAYGVDASALQYAKEKELIYAEFKPDWNLNGKAAGPIRNMAMALYGDILLLIWDGSSKGSASMKKAMIQLKKPILEVKVVDGDVGKEIVELVNNRMTNADLSKFFKDNEALINDLED